MSGAIRRYGFAKATTIAIVAYALVLQALLGALTGSAKAAADVWQIPGILCSEHGTLPGTPDPSGQARHDMQCCILHCMGLDSLAGPTDPAPGLLLRIPVAGVPSHFAAIEIVRRTYGFRPLGARAPPVSI